MRPSRLTKRILSGVVRLLKRDARPVAPWRTTPDSISLDGTASRRPAMGLRSALFFLGHCSWARYPLASQKSTFSRHAWGWRLIVGGRNQHQKWSAERRRSLGGPGQGAGGRAARTIHEE